MADVIGPGATATLMPPTNAELAERSGQRQGPMLGKTGLRSWSGYIHEEFLHELHGERGYRVYDEMRRNEPMCAGLLNAITGVISGLDWPVVPKDSTNGADKAAAAHVSAALERMRRGFGSVITDICTMFPFGYSVLEDCYKYEDGKVWWDDWAFRGQDSLFRWEFDERGQVSKFVQRPAPDYQEITIPMNKFLLFRTTEEKGNPEGLSILRPAYKPYYYKKVLEEIEAMGCERDLIGLPIIKAPFGATPDEIAECQQLVERIKNDDQAGVVLTALGPEPHQKFDLSLLTGQGSAGKVSYTDRLIQRYAAEIGLAALAQFLHLGMAGKSGSYALSSDQRDMFQIALRGWVGKILDVINIVAIPRLLALNGMSGKCTMKSSRISQLNLQTIGNFITAGVQNKFLTVDRALEQFLRKEAELPPLEESAEAISEAGEAEPMAPLPPGLAGAPVPGELPVPGSPGNTSGLNANPGENQRGMFKAQATGQGKIAGGIPAAASEPAQFGGPGSGRYPKGSGGEAAGIAAAKAEIAKGEYEYYGIRVTEGPLTIGETLGPSFVWEHGDQTGDDYDPLPGTSAVGIKGTDVEAAVAVSHREGYLGHHVSLIAGNSRQHGDDYGEIIIKDAVPLVTWTRLKYLSEEPLEWAEDLARDLDDADIWEAYALKTVATFAGDFWS